MKRLILFCLMSLLLSAGFGFAADRRVPEDYATIQDAVHAARDGDTILLADKIFVTAKNRNIDLDTKSLTVKSASNNPQKCVIDCQYSGRAFLVSGGQSLHLQGITIRHARAASENYGGAIYNFESEIYVDNCIFTDNQAGRDGGAVACYNYYDTSYSIAEFSHCRFLDNQAEHGGAVAVLKAPASTSPMPSLSVTDCYFENNVSYGGGAIFYDLASVNILKSTFITNQALLNPDNSQEGIGGAISSYQDNASTPIPAPSIITGCTFTENRCSGMFGGAIYAFYGMVTESRFTGNRAMSGAGGAIAGRVWAVANCSFVDNHSTLFGGGCYAGAMNLKNCSFTRNVSPMGAAVSAGKNNFVAKNCICWGDVGGSEISCDAAEITYSDIQGGYSGTGNIAVDPLFADVANGDLHLCPGSPCIDQGSGDDVPVKDLEGNPRPVGAGVDIGAYEYSETLIWQGGSSDWSAPGNWDPAQTPARCTAVRIVGDAGSTWPLLDKATAGARSLELANGRMTIVAGGKLTLGGS